jgi:signal transduction histidine kinase
VNWDILGLPIAQETDIVTVRQRARLIAAQLGFDAQDQIRIATAASEIARNALAHAGGGQTEFSLENDATAQTFLIHVRDEGPGFPALEAVLTGRQRMAAGITGARRLMDSFEIQPNTGPGVTVTLRKNLPRRQLRVTSARLREIAGQLTMQSPADPAAEISEQNRELLRSLTEERARQEELAHLNSELQDTNRGVVALYAELDEKAEQLRQASELKSRFLSNMTHEFRTPLNSILALSELLLDQVDGPLQAEQAKQIEYIRKSAHSLTELVNDLLDIAKVEAGKLDVRVTEFSVAELFGALRGALRPLRNPAVDLIFDLPVEALRLQTDETKLAQILRNFVSNGLKFTEHGEVRVSMRRDSQGNAVFCVRDTGLGIDPAHHETIFQEFAQVENALQGRMKGIGLGLALSRKLAELLGGGVRVESRLGEGSAFYLTLPAECVSAMPPHDGGPQRVLIIDDEETFRYVLR